MDRFVATSPPPLSPQAMLQTELKRTCHFRTRHARMWRQTHRIGHELSPADLAILRGFTADLWSLSSWYATHGRTTHAAIRRGKVVHAIPTLEYWALLMMTVDSDAPITWRGNELIKHIDRLYMREDHVIAPLAEILEHTGVSDSVVGHCSHCAKRLSFSACVVCTTCLTDLWCCGECMNLDAPSHAEECACERRSAAWLVENAKHVGSWPFVSGVLPPDDDRGDTIPVPFQSAIRLPLIPTNVLFGNSDLGPARVLVHNNVLVRRIMLRELLLSTERVKSPRTLCRRV